MFRQWLGVLTISCLVPILATKIGNLIDDDLKTELSFLKGSII
jgi:hypothetical protein